MKQLIIAATLLVSASSAFAGTGGYSSTTCMSQSGRTVVTVNESDFGAGTLTLVMDGIPAVYKSIDYDRAGIMASGKNGLEVYLIGEGKSRTVVVQKDPRENSAAANNAKSDKQSVSVVCKGFTQEP